VLVCHSHGDDPENKSTALSYTTLFRLPTRSPPDPFSFFHFRGPRVPFPLVHRCFRYPLPIALAQLRPSLPTCPPLRGDLDLPPAHGYGSGISPSSPRTYSMGPSPFRVGRVLFIGCLHFSCTWGFLNPHKKSRLLASTSSLQLHTLANDFPITTIGYVPPRRSWIWSFDYFVHGDNARWFLFIVPTGVLLAVADSPSSFRPDSACGPFSF